MKIYYDSSTGNVENFLTRLKEYAKGDGMDIELVKIDDDTVLDAPSHFFTFTHGKGVLPKSSKKFVANNGEMFLSISSSGSMQRHADTFCFACDVVNKDFGTDIFMRIDLAGTDEQVKEYYNKINLK